jgi:hypothetical protein
LSLNHRRAVGVCSALLFALSTPQLQAQRTETDFAVLRSEQVKQWTQGRGEHLICSITGLGDTAQIHCNPSAPAAGAPLVYHVALIVGPDHVGYIVSCGGGILQLAGCETLGQGRTVTGVVEGGKLLVRADGKDRTYAVINSSNIGPLTGDKGPAPKIAPSVEPDPAPAAGRGALTITSEPIGADITIDGKFVGNTPSVIQLEAGSHKISIEAAGHKTWERTIEVTAGSKVTVQAKLR